MKRQHPTDPNLFWCPKCQAYHDRDGFYENYYGGKCPGECKIFARAKQVEYDSFRNADRYKANRKEWLRKSKEYAKTEAGRKAHKRANEVTIKSLSNCYIRGILKQAGIVISKTMVDLVRQRITMKRTLKQFKKWRKENESNYTDVSGK